MQTYSRNQSYSLRSRLASYILLTARHGIYRERHTETAGFPGVTYRHLLYVLAGFVKEGLLEKTPRGYLIVEEDALRRVVEMQ